MKYILIFSALLLTSVCAAESDWNPRAAYLKQLVDSVPGFLSIQNKDSGRFGKEPWITEDQNVIFQLAAAWSIQDTANPYYHDQAVLEAIMKGGDALVDSQDKDGNWTFRKKDNSTWGQTLEPWAFNRWMRAYHIIQSAMPAERRATWEKAMLVSLKRLESVMRSGRVHNKTTYHAATMYCAGLCFQREDWKQAAHDFMAKVVAEQSLGGWWSEHSGPVVGYNRVYVEGLGLYYALSHDAGVLEALRRGALYHATLTYPNGSSVETVDERNPFHEGVDRGKVGFSFTPEGRGYLLRQSEPPGKWSVSTDDAAAHLLYGETGAAKPTAADGDENLTVLGNNEALVLRKKPWFICLSAFTCEQSTSRWIQDRQNFMSIFHDRAGLIIGGGNTKLQPLWSNFTIGNTGLLKHQPGDEKPEFVAKRGLIHLPTKAALRADQTAPGIDLAYGTEQCRLTAQPLDDTRLKLICESTVNTPLPVEGHIVFLPHVKASLKTAAGKSATLGEKVIEWSSRDVGGWFECHGVRVGVPPGSTLRWPARAHNPYKKDGRSTLEEARLVLCVPFTKEANKREITVEILSSSKPE
ncbi:MAG: hypothetical protein K1X78_15095 [Verrucomicrobiaceae bacterium]|nr:hypothetical protein [Verrucomicrobiaceae bacterium]